MNEAGDAQDLVEVEAIVVCEQGAHLYHSVLRRKVTSLLGQNLGESDWLGPTFLRCSECTVFLTTIPLPDHLTTGMAGTG